MFEHLHPGVYVGEKSSGVRPIEGVSTSTAAFVGAAAKGVPNRATFITNWREFVAKFGDVSRDGPYLPYAVEQFFSNGGKRCYIVRALSDASSELASVDLPSREGAGAARNTLHISATGKGEWGNALAVLVEDGSASPTREFRLAVLADGKPVEMFDDLSLDPNSDSYVETAINDASDYIRVKDLHAAVPLANGKPVQASRVTTAALATPLTMAAADTLTLAVPGGETVPDLKLASLPTPLAPAALAAAINLAWNKFNLTAVVTDALDPAGADRLRVSHNNAGYDNFFVIGGGATTAGRPLAGLEGFAQGQGAVAGASLRTAATPTFPIAAGSDKLQISVHGDALPDITLTPGAAVPIDALLAELTSAFASDPFKGLLVARRDGGRIVIATANRGAADSALLIAGSAAASLTLTQADGTAPPATGVNGLGRSEPAFVQSAKGPFTVEDNSDLSFLVNNGKAGADSAPIVVRFTTGASFDNLQKITPEQLRDAINTAAAGALAASVVDGRVVVAQSRRGNYYRLQVKDGRNEPNIRIRFDTGQQSGAVDGDLGSPYFRPALRVVAGVNEAYPLTNGNDGSLVGTFELIGTSDTKTGLHALDDVDDVNFIAIPGYWGADVVGAAAGYCGLRQDCFFIADAPGKSEKSSPVTDPAHVRDHMRNKVTTKNSYAALYYPWLEIADRAGAGKNPRRFVPPSGFMAGMFARIDNQRGVWKAPAGTEAGIIGAIGLEYAVTDSEQDILNPIGVNCIRQFAASGVVVWGARTFATLSDPEYRYVPVRRYTIYLRQSIYRGTQWAVFEPNDAPLWGQLKANIDDFMMGEFRKGALAGVTPAQAFDVKCDAELNPPSEVNAGRVNMEIRFAPLRPAEFVIISISQKSQRPQG
jgi:phage tail sheath protein FI